MPSVYSILRKRAARRSQNCVVDRIALTFVGLVGSLIIAGMLGIFLIGIFLTLIINDLPQVSQLERLFVESGDGFPELSVVYDRTREEPLFALLHPAAANRIWLGADLEDPNSIPLNLIIPLLVTQDDSFWVHNGFDGEKFVGAIFDILTGTNEQEIYRSIPQRLAEITLLPAKDFRQGNLIRYLKSATLAQALDKAFSKNQLLEWYINLADFGNFAFGVDAASLLYYGKHAAQLSAGEGAMLAALPIDPTSNPIDNYAKARVRQIFILATMEQRALISRNRLINTNNEPKPSYPIDDANGLMKIVEQRLRLILGSELMARPGLDIRTSIDRQLQNELQCVANAFLNIPGSLPISLEANVETCSSAQLLHPARGDRQPAERGAIIVMDPTSGELLASYGQVDFPRSAPGMLIPFSYLTAFSKGLSPGSMILDLPTLEQQDSLQAHGPVRMRTALVGAYPFAAERVMQLVGQNAILEVLDQMGISDKNGDPATPIAPIGLTPSLLELVKAYAVIANEGRMVGQSQPRSNTLQPLLITQIVDSSQHEIYRAQLERRSVLSPSLAYLLVNVLADSGARRNVFGNTNIFELDTVTAVVIENIAHPKADNWTIGFTPARVVGVWVENPSGDEVGVLDGSAPLWRAIMEYVSQDAGAQGWLIPIGVQTLEVCDPSGKLPTRSCPKIVEEVFIDGTVPLQLDDLYKEIRVNRETGKLATVFTPWDLVEQRLYFLPPSEAAAWAKENGIERPPTEYDPAVVRSTERDDVSISFPAEFVYARGMVLIRGNAGGKDFSHYRLAFGQGLYPETWFLIDEQHQAVENGLLGEWDTNTLDGIFTLQLTVVAGDGTIAMLNRAVTVDNQSPQIESFSAAMKGQSVVLSASATDNIAAVRVDFYINGRKMASSNRLPFEAAIALQPGEHYEAFALAYDAAGNRSENSALIIIKVDA